MEVNTTRLREAIKGVQRLIDSGSVSDEMIATAYVLAFPPSVALLVLDELIALEANARLIAAAPLLLEVLERVSKALEGKYKFERFVPDLLDDVRAVIAKAEGRDHG